MYMSSILGAAHAFNYLHMQGVAIRDLKLENILLDRTDSSPPLLKICDFGYSKVTDCLAATAIMQPCSLILLCDCSVGA